MPYYDFQKRNIVQNFWESFKLIVKLLLLVFGTIYLVKYRIMLYFLFSTLSTSPSMKILIVLISLCDFFGFFLTLNTVKIVLMSPKVWQQLFNITLDFEKMVPKNIIEKKYLRNGLVQNKVAHAVILIYLAISMTESIIYDIYFDVWAFGTYSFYFYYSMILLGLQINLAICIKLKYRDLYSSLQEAWQGILFSNIGDLIAKIRTMYLMMNNVVAIYNTIFDTNNQLIFIYFGCLLLQMFFGTVMLIEPSNSKYVEKQLRTLVLCLGISLLILITVSFILLQLVTTQYLYPMMYPKYDLCVINISHFFINF